MIERSSIHNKRKQDPPADTYKVDEESKREAADARSIQGDPVLNSKEKNPHAVALGRLGGKKGGRARAAKLTAEQRSAIARKGASARWRRRNENQC